MRTTVEITAQQHLALTSLAAQRGIRGFSLLVQEAIELYLSEQQGDRAAGALALEGVLGEPEAGELERRIADAWSSWPKTSS